jgi:hypothetical protein
MVKLDPTSGMVTVLSLMRMKIDNSKDFSCEMNKEIECERFVIDQIGCNMKA